MAKFEITWLEDRSDEAVLEEIRCVAAMELGRRLTVKRFDSVARIKSTAVRDRFGSWSKATRRAGLTGALPVYSDAAIIEDLKHVSASCQNEPFTLAFYSKRGNYSGSCIKRRFGGWREALDAAGIGSRFVGPPTTERMKSQPGRAMSDEEILAKIRDVSAQLGNRPIAGADIAANSEITQNLMYRRFGSVSAALRRAGVEQVSHGRRHTESEVFENLLNVWTHYGRPPTVSEMDLPPSTIGKNTYLHRYRGWRNALKSFVERANSETDADLALATEQNASMLADRADAKDGLTADRVDISNPEPVNQSTTRSRVTSYAKANVKPEERRDPSIGTRFKVLQRDQFRCKLCGRSPANELNCELHVDHIVPFSKGGRTTLENLQALCSHCNVGKSNRSV